MARQSRLDLLDGAYGTLTGFSSSVPALPVAAFGVVVERLFHRDWSEVERERFAYEVLLNKFDAMLRRVRREGLPNRGLVIHDRRVVAERDIQSWTSEWRAAAGNIGQLRNLADVPLFSDSRATRLLQLADLVAYALYRSYSVSRDTSYLDLVWPAFDHTDTEVHGCIHYTPDYGTGGCSCAPCRHRLMAEASRMAQPARPV